MSCASVTCFSSVCFTGKKETRLSWLWPPTTATPRAPWFSDSRYETTTPAGSWSCSSVLTSQNLAGNDGLESELQPLVWKAIIPSMCHREALQSIFDEVRVVDVMDSGDAAHLSLMKRPDLGVTFTKLHCWTLTHYSKCVFMDADTLVRSLQGWIIYLMEANGWAEIIRRCAQVLSNVDELFEREELSAAPDPGWPDCFNSGVFVFRPSNETHEKLLEFCSENGSFDGERWNQLDTRAPIYSNSDWIHCLKTEVGKAFQLLGPQWV